MIIGQIKNGIKKCIEWRFRSEDMADLETWRKNLIVSRTTMGIEEAKKSLEALKDLNRILN